MSRFDYVIFATINMLYRRNKSLITTTMHKIACICFTLVFVNFSIQFDNYFIAKIISVTVTTKHNTIDNNLDIFFNYNVNTTEEHNEESETKKNNSNKKTEYLNIHNNLCYISTLNSIKNHSVMANMDEVSLEIPSPPPWT